MITETMSSWNWKKVSAGKVTEQTSFTFENDENKFYSLVIINDASKEQYLFNQDKDTGKKSGIRLSRQYIVSNN